MAENKVLKNITSVYTDKSINGWLRGAIWVGTIVIVYIGGRAIYKKIFPTDEQKRAKENQKQIENELNNSIKTKPLTYPLSQYNTWADAIADAFTGCDVQWTGSPYSFSWQVVKDIFEQLKNNSDYLQLVKSYGIRTIEKGFICGGNYTDLDFQTAAGHQFNNIEINVGIGVLPSLNKTLKNNGISYQLTTIN
jgi:hypothetical protein